MKNAITVLKDLGIQPTAQRVAIAEAVLDNTQHPTADEILVDAQKRCSIVSRATVYNTLNLFVEKGLLRTQVLKEGTVVFDPNVENHHHFIDEEDGTIIDIPWNWLSVHGKQKLEDFDIRDYQVILRGTRRSR
ncbi:MAG TPA: Fur family transcriptional regulator [Bacteroidota bacterium]|nr:Fur family transcriptional regulator [Bacteroidota bacterium]